MHIYITICSYKFVHISAQVISSRCVYIYIYKIHIYVCVAEPSAFYPQIVQKNTQINNGNLCLTQIWISKIISPNTPYWARNFLICLCFSLLLLDSCLIFLLCYRASACIYRFTIYTYKIVHMPAQVLLGIGIGKLMMQRLLLMISSMSRSKRNSNSSSKPIHRCARMTRSKSVQQLPITSCC